MSPIEFLESERGSKARRLLFLLLLSLALVSTAVGLINAIHRSQDFQWSGERVLLAHGDPWAEYLAGDPGHHFLASQVPNYLAILYVLILPVGLLPLLFAKVLWALLNIVSAVVCSVIAGRSYGLRWRSVCVVICLMLTATATRNTIGNGQQGLLVLLVWSLALFPSQLGAGREVGVVGRGRAVGRTRALVAGIAFLKYSFAPPLALLLLFRGGVKAVLLSAVPALLAVVAVWLWITGGHDPAAILRLALEPFAVARHGFTAGPADPNLMNLLESLLRSRSEDARNSLELLAALSACVAVSYFAFGRNHHKPVQWQIAIMATMSYGLFKHHAYDAVVLLLPLCYALKHRRQPAAQAVLVLIAYLFYLQRGLEALHLHALWMRIPEFLMLMSILGCTYRLGVVERKAVEALGIHAVPRRQRRAAA